MATGSSIAEAFECAKEDFLTGLEDKDQYDDFSHFRTINDVYDETDRIQEDQSKKGKLRYLKKIKPYLDCISQYAGVIETLVQSKADLLAPIWGPIKFLLQISSTYVGSFDKIVSVMGEIGGCLPQFNDYLHIFKASERIRHVLCLFYKDILEFHGAVLKFFRLKGWKTFFEILWPQCGDRISVIMENIARHKVLMDREVTLADINEAYKARTRAFDEYEKNRVLREQEQLEFFKSSLSPRLYDDDLQRIEELACQDTGRWLEKEDVFRRWSDPDSKSAPLLWLSGIPGAGKTFLSAAVIRRTIDKKQPIVFAFLSYKNNETVTRIRVLHSFLLQLLHDNKLLQPVLIDANVSKPRQLQNDTKFVRNLFVDVLNALDKTTYMVIDGLDEIDEAERQALLQTILDLLKDCSKLRIWIGSRPEAGLSRLLKPEAKLVSIGSKNREDIRRYVARKTDEILGKLDVDASTSAEIRGLLGGIPQRAEGMFLYARLVMHNLDGCTRIEHLQDEARNLPKGLDEAYGRIIYRIDKQLGPYERSDAKEILGWIASTKIPLKREELEHILMIRRDNRKLERKNRLLKDIVELCGPIVEFQGDSIVFVHFTVKEYICSQQSNFFVREAAASRQAAIVCMTYLSFTCFDNGLDQTQIDDYILSGEYILQAYAESQWLEHVKRGCESMDGLPSFDEMHQAVEGFRAIREGERSDESLKSVVGNRMSFKAFQQKWPDTYDWLCALQSSAHSKQTIGMESGGVQALLTLSGCFALIRRRFGILLDNCCASPSHRPGCHCLTLRKFYGDRLYKCVNSSCKFARIGFRSKSDRDRHILCHERPFKCAMTSCDFSAIGFISRHHLETHLSVCPAKEHHKPSPSKIGPLSQPLDPGDLESALFVAVKAEAIELVRDILEQLPNPPLEKLREIALVHSSAPMVKFIFDLDSDHRRTNSYQRALRKSGASFGFELPLFLAIFNPSKVAVIKLLLENGADVNSTDCISGGMRKGSIIALAINNGECSAELFQIFLQWGADLREEDIPVLCRRLGESPSFLNIARLLLENNPDAIEIAKKSFALHTVSNGEGCIETARFLLELGFDIDARTTGGHTALYFAATRKSSKGRARLMQFLLENGANPSITCSGRSISALPGPKNISRWLGMSWDALLESTRGARGAPSAGELVSAEFSGVLVK